MDLRLLIITRLLSLSLCFSACSQEREHISDSNKQGEGSINLNEEMRITIGTAVFTATTENNATVEALKQMLPLTVEMDELNGNEKYYYLQDLLPITATGAGKIEAGEVMLYGNNCLVVFYESFLSPYKYTRIGKIKNVSGLADALGSKNVKVTFEMIKL